MKSLIKFELLFLLPLLLVWLSACQTQPGTEILSQVAQDTSELIGFVSSSPHDLEKNVPIDAQVQFTFSGSVNAQSVQDGVSFRVTDNAGRYVPGDITFNADSTQLIWKRRLSSQNVPLEPATHYHISAQFLTDTANHDIPPWFIDFNTQDFAPSRGRFYVTKDSDTWWLGPNSSFEIGFSEPVSPNTETCNDQWKNAFQVLDAGTKAVVGVSGNICLICRYIAGNRFCDRLRFTPIATGGRSGWEGLSEIMVVIRPSIGFEGMYSKESLKEPATKFFTVAPDITPILSGLLPK